MQNSVRIKLKTQFDRIVYRRPLLNKVLRNLNKKLSFATSFKLRPFGIMKVKLKSGVTFKMSTNETSSVTKLLFWNGADDYEYTYFFERLIPHCKTFIDVGANIGYYSLLAGRKNPSIKVYAIEPASAPRHYLQENIAINKLQSSVQASDIALSNTEGKIEFFEVDNYKHVRYNLAGTGTLRKEDTPVKVFKSQWVVADTLDNFVIKNNISAVDLIKLDTEGTENLILLAADNVLRNHKPIIICETLFQVIEKHLEKIMTSYNYGFYNYKDGKLFRVNSIIREKDDGVRDCFFVHQDKFHLIENLIA